MELSDQIKSTRGVHLPKIQNFQVLVPPCLPIGGLSYSLKKVTPTIRLIEEKRN